VAPKAQTLGLTLSPLALVDEVVFPHSKHWVLMPKQLFHLLLLEVQIVMDHVKLMEL